MYTMSDSHTHCIKKLGTFTVLKYLSFNEIHVCIKKDGVVIDGMHGVFQLDENSKAAKYYDDLCMYAMVERTKEIRRQNGMLPLL